MSAPLPAPASADAYGPDAVALSQVLAVSNPARYAARIVVPPVGDAPGAWIVSASPELYVAVDGPTLTSSPIKGTAAPGAAMLDKDVAENVMITDLVRNDLSHVAVPGSVEVPELLGEHSYPGSTHLQSTVAATLAPDYDWTPALWPALLAGTFPRGRSAALRNRARWTSSRARRPPRAARTAARSGGSTRTRGWPSSPSGSARSGGRPTTAAASTSARAPGLRGGATPSANGTKRNLRPNA